MSTDTIPVRGPGQNAVAGWWNLLRSVLAVSIVPRNSSGVATDQFGSLGLSSRRWLDAYFTELRVMAETHYAGLAAPSGMAGDYTLTLPSALPASGNALTMISDAGEIELYDVDPSLDSETGPDFMVANLGIRRPHLEALGQIISSNSGNASTTSATLAQITNQSTSITTTGRPVFIGFVVNSGADSAIFRLTDGTKGTVVLKRGSTEIARLATSRFGNALSSFKHIDVPSAGTYTYTAEWAVTASGPSGFQVNSLRLIAFEYC